MDLAGWLRRLGLGQYEAAFRENEIDETILPKLTAEDLKDLGISIVGHRRKLLDAIAALRTDGSAKPSASDASASRSGGGPEDRAERRQVTVMFSDLVGSTALSGRMDPEDLREVISAYQNCVGEIVPRFGGFVAKYMGDGVLIYFGYPQAHEDDAERAVRAGLELVAEVGSLKTPTRLQTRVGIATGLVVVGDLIGSGPSQEQAIIGETPNLAARLQGVAEPDSVVIADSTRRLVGNLFELDDLGAQNLKGMEPVRAWAAMRPSSVESRFEALHASGMTALVGRKQETELLLRCWSNAKTGEGQVVLLSGEAGIGKSRVTAALLERLASEPHTRLRYFCSPQHTDSAFYPIIGQMERAAGLQRDDTSQAKLDKLDALLAQTSTAKEDVALLAEMLSLPNDGRYPTLDLTPQQRRHRTLEALTTQLERLAIQRPLLMIFEDVHWIDPTSLETLTRSIDQIKALPALLVVTFRPEFVVPWAEQSQMTSIVLNRLGERDVATIVSSLAGNRELPADVLADIVERTDGVPLFVEEMTKAVLEAESESEARKTAAAVPSSSTAVPASLHASLMARLDRLGQATKEVAQVGATIGRDFPYELLALVVQKSEPDLQTSLGRLNEAGLMFCQGIPPNATFYFKHALVRDAAYGSLLRQRRRQLHGQIATVLESRDPELKQTQPETLALHYAAAGFSDRAVDYYMKAAERSMAASANMEAIAHLKTALDLLKTVRSSPERTLQEWRALIAMGPPLIATQSWAASEVETVYLRARELASSFGEGPELCQTLVGLWVFYLVRARLSAALDLATQLLQLAERIGSPDLAILAHLAGVASHYWSGDPARVPYHAEKVLGLYNLDAHGGHKLMSQDPAVTALSSHALSLWLTGYPDQAHEMSLKAIALARTIGHPFTLCLALEWDAFLRHMRQEPDLVADRANECHSVAAQQGFANFAADAIIHGEWAGAGLEADHIVKIRKAMDQRLSLGTNLAHPFFASLLAQQLAKRGAGGEAIAILADAIAQTERTGEGWWQPEMYRMMGDLCKMAGSSGREIEKYYRIAIERAQQRQAKSHELRACTSLAYLWLDQGKRNDARDLLEPTYCWFTEGFRTPGLKQARALLDNLQ